MGYIMADAKAKNWYQAGLSLLWALVLLTTPQLAAHATGPEDGPITDGVYPSLVVLTSFTTDTAGPRFVVQWQTETERHNAGFNLYRSNGDSQLSVKLNQVLIPSQAVGEDGASYEFVDASAVPGATYDYWLESVDLHGLASYLGTITITVPVPAPPASSRGMFRVFLPIMHN